MNLRLLSIICAALFFFELNAFADSKESFVRKIKRGGKLSVLIQTSDGGYAYLSGSRLTKLPNVSRKNIPQTEFTFDVYYYAGVVLRGMTQTSNGFALVGEYIDGYYSSNQGVVVKLNSKGRMEWTKSTSVNGKMGYESVIPTTDGGFIVTGWAYPVDEHPVLIKYGSPGEVQWSKSFDSLSWSFQSTATLDGGVLLAADLIQVDGKFIGVKVIKINGSGEIVWASSLEMKDFALQSLTSLSDQRFLLAGKAGDLNKLLLVTLNSDGTIYSKAAYSLNVPNFAVSSLVQTQDGGVAIGGVLKRKTGATYDGFLLKINERQQLTLQKRLGFQNSEETISSVIAKEDGSFLLFGSSGSDTLLVGLNSDGSMSSGCAFSHNLDVSKALFGNVKHQSLTLPPNVPSLHSGAILNVKLKHSTVPILDACRN